MVSSVKAASWEAAFTQKWWCPALKSGFGSAGHRFASSLWVQDMKLNARTS